MAIFKKAIFRLIFILFTNILFHSQLAHSQGTTMKSSDIFGRKYKAGETYRYKLTMEEYQGGKWNHTNIAICELKVVLDSNKIPFDEVNWISLKKLSPKDTIDLSSVAARTKPYLISLDEHGRLDLPRIEVPELTEPIQDFNTFFVAVSPNVGTGSLIKKNDSFRIREPVVADFSNGSNILIGQDCLDIGCKLISLNDQNVSLHTSFFPPHQPRLKYLTPDMNIPVVNDTVNNFQMVYLAAPEKYLVQYGREFFYIDSKLNRKDGKIQSAYMFNQLNLKMKINCDKDYNNCQFSMPFSEIRILRLELLQD